MRSRTLRLTLLMLIVVVVTSSAQDERPRIDFARLPTEVDYEKF